MSKMQIRTYSTDYVWVSHTRGLGGFGKATTLTLSQKISIGSWIEGTTPRSPMKFFNHTAALDASQAAIYSDSQVESATVSCFELFHDTAPPFNKNTQPD